MAEAPIFLLGSPRSGTTLLRLALSAHPAIVIAPECSFLTWLHPAFEDWSAADLDSDRVEAFVDAVVAARKFETWGVSGRSIRDAIARTRPTTYADLAEIPYRLYAESVGKGDSMWGDKNNVHLTTIPLIRTIYPEATFVHIVRDVRDTWASAREIDASASNSPYVPRLDTDPVRFAEEWSTHNRDAADLLEHGTGYCRLRYEDLVLNPRGSLAPVLGVIGVEWDDAILDFPHRSVSEPDATMEWKGLTRESFTSSRVGRWRDAVAAEVVATLTDTARPALERFGYPT